MSTKADGGIRLLSLDGGGVRGLSSLMILDSLMKAVNPDNVLKPCEYFDMIGGTSTGGLIAVMLGRLHMTVDECIDTYKTLSERVFQKRHRRVTFSGRLQGRFDTKELERAIKQIIVERGLGEDALLKNDTESSCKAFVCATSQQTGQVLCLRSYRSQRDGNSRLTDTIKIWQACRATSAATTFFEPITIGPYDQTFVDGALGDNNPVSKLWSEAKDIWGDELEKKLKCLVSIGTGLPNLSPVRDDVFRIFSTLKAIAVETEKTARDFHRDKSQLDNGGRYYRFNVQRGLEDIGLEESTKFGQLASATHGYLEDQAIFTQLQACAQKLSKNENAILEKRDIVSRYFGRYIQKHVFGGFEKSGWKLVDELDITNSDGSKIYGGIFMTTYRDTDNKMFLTIPSVYGYNRADWKIVTPHSTYYPGTHSGHLIFPPDLPIFEPAVYWDTTIFNPFVSASGTFSGDLRDIWSWSSSSSLVGVVSTMASLLLVPPRDVSNPRLSGEFYLHVIRGDLQELDREDDTSMRQMTNFFSRAFNRHDNVTQDRQQSDVSEMLDLTDLQPIHEYHRQSSSDAIECFINKVLVPKCHIELPVSVNGKSHTEYFAGVVTYHDWIQGELEWAKLLIKKSPRMVTYIPSDHQANRNKWYEM